MIMRRLALGFGLFCGVIASQAPEFAQQYRQRLGGALDELTSIVEQFSSEAKSAGLETKDAIARLEANGEQLARDRGRSMEQTIARHARLDDQQKRMREAGPFVRLIVLAETYDPRIAQRAWGDFDVSMGASAGSHTTIRVSGRSLRRTRATPFSVPPVPNPVTQ